MGIEKEGRERKTVKRKEGRLGENEGREVGKNVRVRPGS